MKRKEGKTLAREKKISRTVVTTIIRGGYFELDQETRTPKIVELDEVKVFNETVSEDKAVAVLRKAYGKGKNYIVTELVKHEDNYSMPLDLFLEMAVVETK